MVGAFGGAVVRRGEQALSVGAHHGYGARPGGGTTLDVLPLLAGTLVLCAAVPAHAYRTFADDPEVAYPARWTSSSIEWDVSSSEPLEGWSPADLHEAAQGAFAIWTAVGCADVQVGLGTVTSAPAQPGDGRNTIAVVSHDWTGRGFPAGRGATTDVRLERAVDELTGEEAVRIVEADIYLNAEDYGFVSDEPASGELDLRALLVHELGHLLGLLHVCEHDGLGGAPGCVDAALQTSALYPDYLGARTLSDDDAAGLCALYPAGAACDVTCPVGTECRDGLCVDPACGEPFCPDPCLGEECDVGRCAPDSSCEDGACALVGENRGYCVSEGSSGAQCTQGGDCTSRLCLTSESLGSYCTVECIADAECGGTQRCAEVDGVDVCAPLPPQSGCSVAARARGAASVPLALPLLALLLRIRRRGPR